MNTRISICLIISLFLSGCAAIAAPAATPIQQVPTLPPLEDAAPTATAFIPAPKTATVKIPEQTDTPQPTASIPVVQTEITPEPVQTSTPQPEACQPPPRNWVAYTVQRGDTLSSLAQRTGISWQQIQTANCLPGTKILAGQTLYIPFVPQPIISNSSTPKAAVETPDTPSASDTPKPTIETPPPPGPGDPTVTVDPTSGPPTTNFKILITDFEANEPVTIRIFYVPTLAIVFEKNAVVNANRELTEYFPSPAGAAIGEYTVDVSGTSSAATGEFTITSK